MTSYARGMCPSEGRVTCGSPKCPNKAIPGRNRGLCEKHYRVAPLRGYVDATPARERLALLRSRGVTVKSLAAYGLSSFGVRRIETAPRIRGLTEAKVFAVPLPACAVIRSMAHVDGVGTARRIKALGVMGWPQSVIAVELGTKQWAVSAMLYRPRVTSDMAARVAELYDRWSMTVGPSSASARKALAAGWFPPLAWDDIDDPASEPNLGVHTTVRAIDRYEELRSIHLTRWEICQKLGIQEESLDRNISRAGAA